MTAGVKAGLVAGLAAAILYLFGFVEALNAITCGLAFLVYAAAGVLAVYWMDRPVQMGPAAGQGAIAGGIAALIGTIAFTIQVTVRVMMLDSAALLSQLTPEMLEQFEASGMDPSFLTSPSVGVMTGGLCCVPFLVAGVLLGALGAAIFAAARRGPEPSI